MPNHESAGDPRLATGWLVELLLWTCVAVTVLWGIVQVPTLPDAAHDAAVVRTLGLGSSGPFRTADVIVGGALAWLPLGTRALRASAAVALVSGAGAACIYSLAWRAVREARADGRYGPIFSAIATLSVTLSVPWQLESATPGGAVTGATLALLPLAWMLREGGRTTDGGRVAFLVGLAFAQEMAVGLVAVFGVASFVLASQWGRMPFSKWSFDRRKMAAAAGGFVLGLTPLLWGSLRWSTAESKLERFASAAIWVEGSSHAGASFRALAESEIGPVYGLLLASGMVAGFWFSNARSSSAALLAALGASMVGIRLGAPHGPARYGSATLVMFALLAPFAATGMVTFVGFVRKSSIGGAAVSSALLAIMFAALPLRGADDVLVRRAEIQRRQTAAWNDAALGDASAGALVFTSSPLVHARLLADRAAGLGRGDVLTLQTAELSDSALLRRHGADSRFAPLLRVMALRGAPDEWALSQLAAAYPVLLTFDPTWDRLLARHLVPIGLFTQFETEPRGTSDRQQAAAGFPGKMADLAGRIERPRDHALSEVTATLLRSRALAFAAVGDRDLVAATLEALRPFSPDDPLGSELARRISFAKGATVIHDLRP